MNLTLFSVLICFILLAHNVILVNEESLILICFIITINILIKQFNHLLDSPFQSSKISNRENLNSVLSKIEKSLENLISYLTKNSFLIDVKKFNKYLLNLVNNFTYWKILQLFIDTKKTYLLSFQTLKILENEVIKLLHFCLNSQLYQKILIQSFLFSTKIQYFSKTQGLLILREFMQTKKGTLFYYNK